MTAEVMHQLKKSGVSNEALPWFMVLGPKDSGKSNVLVQSKLIFSWEHKISDDYQWMFSDKAIFIEISVGIPQEEWRELLLFLKKSRPRIPLNGILLVLNSTVLDLPLKALREFLADITETVGYLFPITVIFTHLDAVAGFEVFFENTTETCLQYHHELYEKLLGRVLSQSQSQQAVDAKLSILNFPDNFRITAYKIDSILTELCRGNPYQETPDVRDVFLTAKSLLVAGLFEHVIQNNAGGYLKSRKKAGFARWMTAMSIAIASVMVLLVFLISSASFAHTTMVIHQGIRLGHAVQQSNNTDDFVNLVNYLSAKPPEMLSPILEKLLLKNLDYQVMPNMFHSLEDQLAMTQERWALATSEEEEAMRGDYYNQLKTYLMFCHPRYRSPQFYQGNPLMAFYLNHSHQRWPERSDLVQLSRQQLYLSDNLKNIYAGFKAWGEKQLGKFSPRDLAGNTVDNSVKLFLFFTARGFNQFALPEINRLTRESAKGDWVMHAPPEAIKDKLLSLYKSDYKTAWVNFLGAIKPATGEKISESTVRKLLSLAHQNILFEDLNLSEYFKKISHLSVQDNQAVALINNAVSVVSDPSVRGAVSNILLLPIRAEYLRYLNKISQQLNSAWQSQVYEVYRQTLSQKYPFLESSSAEEVTSEDLSQLFDPSQGLFWLFVHQKLGSYLSSQWLGMKMNFSPEFIKALSQANVINAGFNFEIYPEPTLGLKEIRLVINHQTYRYRNDPQEWQSLHWRLEQSDPDTVLEIVTDNGSQGSIEINSPWGLFKLLQKAELSENSDGEFKAHWTIHADNGHAYPVNLMFKSNHDNNLFEVLLFEHFSLPSFVVREGG